MKIDIAVPFNDIIPPQQIGMVLENKPPYYDQVVHLVNSINTNWDTSKHDYKIHLFHSRNLEETKKEKLESLGCNVVHNPSELQPLMTRENIFSYNYSEKSDYTIILDTDMLVLNTPELNLDKDIYARLSPNQDILSEPQWDWAHKALGLSNEPQHERHFNCGCIIIKSELRKDFYKETINNLPVLRQLEKFHRHFGIQFYNSLLFKKFDWGHLPAQMNVFPQEMDMSEHQPVEILHYLGRLGLRSELKEIYSLYD